jgi:hypothetical protein
VECVHRASTGLDALLEVQRIAPGARFVAVNDEAFDAALSAAYSGGAGAAADFDLGDMDLAALADSAASVDDLLDTRDDAPVIRLINALLLEAVKEGASDVHIETQEKRLVVRFRVDGVLRDMIEPPRALAPLLVSRIKVMAKLDIAERRVPQDGRVTLRIGGHDVDARVSTIPTQHGERVVMRLLEKGSLRLDLEALGMSARDRDIACAGRDALNFQQRIEAGAGTMDALHAGRPGPKQHAVLAREAVRQGRRYIVDEVQCLVHPPKSTFTETRPAAGRRWMESRFTLKSLEPLRSASQAMTES